MNENVRKLAEQSGLKVESWMTNPPKPFQILGTTEQFEKFAELLVKECTSFCQNHGDMEMDGYGDYFVSNIEDHFGVK